MGKMESEKNSKTGGLTLCAHAQKGKVTGRRKLLGKGRRPKPFKNGKITVGEIRKAVNADKEARI